MTRKDYILLAVALRNARPPDGETRNARLAWLAAVCGVADACTRDNPRFDSDRFLNACDATHAQGFT
ncbi:MAG: hypothetical protein ACREJC_17140, partial [Tepidisphaeraceae bacterium]